MLSINTRRSEVAAGVPSAYPCTIRNRASFASAQKIATLHAGSFYRYSYNSKNMNRVPRNRA
ncbi:MAG: hypothetical protein ACI9KS_001914 [Sulfitobacter sp.]|jgi:hypothetical protein